MISGFKRYDLLKFSFIFSIVFFLFLGLQTLAFSDVFSTDNKSFASTKEPTNLTDSVKKNFNNKNDDNNKTGYQNQTLNEQNIKIVAAGDFGCGPVAQSNIKQVEIQKPDIFLVIGDLSYEPSLDCWYDMTKALDTKTKIAIGNHEGDEEKEKGGSQQLTNSLLKHYNLPNSYYSFNFGNIHFLALDTQLEFSFNIFKPEDEEEEEENTNYKDKSNIMNGKSYATTLADLLTKYNITAEIPPGYLLNDKMIVENIPFDTEQYKFVVNDLEKASTNSSIDWIIVMFHKPIYSSLSSHMQEYIMRENYQPVFDKYGVDIVLQGHNHMYDRTLPIKFNPLNISKPIVDKSTNNTNNFFNPDGSIFSVIGSGGKSSHIILNHPDYVAKQFNGFGFLSIDINGKDLDAKFYDIGYKCKEEKLTESDMEEGDFIIFDMSSCKNDKSKKPLEIIDRYVISKVS